MQQETPMDKIANILGATALAVMLSASAFNIFSAWFFGRRFGQIEELVLACFVWVTYVGAGSLYRHGEQIKVDFLVQMMPLKIQKVMLVFRDVAVFGCSVIIAYYAILLMLRAAERGMQTATLRISYVIIDFSVLLGFLYMIVDLTLSWIRLISKYKYREEKK